MSIQFQDGYGNTRTYQEPRVGIDDMPSLDLPKQELSEMLDKLAAPLLIGLLGGAFFGIACAVSGGSPMMVGDYTSGKFSIPMPNISIGGGMSASSSPTQAPGILGGNLLNLLSPSAWRNAIDKGTMGYMALTGLGVGLVGGILVGGYRQREDEKARYYQRRVYYVSLVR